MMAPAPAARHQTVSGNLYLQLRTFLKGKGCKVFYAPFDVRLDAAGKDDTVVQPDLLVICDPAKLDDKGCLGAPDLIIEILSPSSAKMDSVIKLEKYRQAGVREYWIVHPDTSSAQVHILENGRYFITGYADEDVIPVHVLDGCEIALADVFDEI
jgi:Uma2 family endonuclease